MLFLAELGDFNEVIHCPGYVSEFMLVPNQTLDFENRVAEIHKTLRYRSLRSLQTANFLSYFDFIELTFTGFYMTFKSFSQVT